MHEQPQSKLNTSAELPAKADSVDFPTLRTARNIGTNSTDVEQLKNGQVDQQIRRRPLRAVATPRTTDGFSHSHSFGLRGSQNSPKTRQSSYRPTPNDYHENHSVNSPNDNNGSVLGATTRKGKAVTLRTAWELPDLIQPLHRPRTRHVRQPRLLAHYPAVIEFVYNHRYVTGFQIQKQFNDYMSNRRTSQYQLASLTDLGYLQQAPVRSTSPNFPAVFAATRRGIALVRQTYANHGIDWQGVATEQLKLTGVALDSILHEVLLTEFDQALRATIESRGDLALVMHERRYFRREKQLLYDSNGRHHRLIPDAGFLLRLASQKCERLGQKRPTLQLNFVEFDNGSLSAARLAAKFEAYNQWSTSESGLKYVQQLYDRYGGVSQQVNFRLLILAHGKSGGEDERRLVTLFTLALDLPRTMRERIWLTTVADMRKTQHGNPPLAAPMWFRIRDARTWLPTFRMLPSGNNSRRRQNAFVRQRVSNLPCHALFPKVRLE